MIFVVTTQQHRLFIIILANRSDSLAAWHKFTLIAKRFWCNKTTATFITTVAVLILTVRIIWIIGWYTNSSGTFAAYKNDKKKNIFVINRGRLFRYRRNWYVDENNLFIVLRFYLPHTESSTYISCTLPSKN